MSAAARRSNPEARRAQLVGAAFAVFSDKGVAATTVSDIVKAAGVAQGTFYLYFDSKDELINAVVETMIDQVLQSIEAQVATPGLSALERFAAVRQAFVEISDEPHEQELQAMFHRPENRAIHDRMVAEMGGRIAPAIERIVAQGIDEGVFVPQNTHIAARAVLGALQGLEASLDGGSHTAVGIDAVAGFALRGLGYQGKLPE